MTYTLPESQQTLANLLTKVQADAARAVDFIAPTSELQFRTDLDTGKSQVIMEADRGAPTVELEANELFNDQVAKTAEIEVRTARRLRTQYPLEYDALINAIWDRQPKDRMIRTYMDGASETRGVARAFVSDKFKTFDNVDVLASTLPQLLESDADWRVWRHDITEKRMYVRLISANISGRGANDRDVMNLGFDLTNSETGCGSVAAISKAVTIACMNGLTIDTILRQSHLTTSRSDSRTWSILSDEAKSADNEALKLKLRDVVGHASQPEAFEETLAAFRAASGDVIEGTVQAAIEQTGKVLRLTKAETSSVLDGLMQTLGQEGYSGEPISRATIVNAVTACAKTANPDDVDQWHDRGAQVLNMRPNQWASIEQARAA